MTVTFVFSELRHKVWVLWHHTSDLISKYTETELTKKAGLSHQQYLTLLTMECINGPVTATDLANRLERNTNSISTLVDRMERRGLVEKVKDLRDRRSVRLAVTRKGKDKLEQATKVGWGLIEELTSDFSEEELQVLANLLEKLRAKVSGEITPGKVPQEIRPKDFQKIIQLLARVKTGAEGGSGKEKDGAAGTI